MSKSKQLSMILKVTKLIQKKLGIIYIKCFIWWNWWINLWRTCNSRRKSSWIYQIKSKSYSNRSKTSTMQIKPIASICHGILVLAAANVIKGKTCSCYPACSPDVTEWWKCDIGYESAIVDGNCNCCCFCSSWMVS